MARDNSPKVRQQKDLQRTSMLRPSYDRILIVSEGSKTEPNYFNEMRSTYRLNTTHIHVRPSPGTAPVQVVEYAMELFKEGDPHKKIQPKTFEKVYAVFDRDDHDTYFDALKLAESFNGKFKNDKKQPVTFQAIASVPSFELWLLLHFEDVSAPLHRDEATRRLKRHMGNYKKGSSTIFFDTSEYLNTAIERAERLAISSNVYNDEPFTAIVELVKLLKSYAR